MSRIKGPLGLWEFPLLNFLYDLILASRSKQRTAPEPRGRSRLSLSAENVERWKVVRSPSGSIEELVIHREVKD